MKVKELIKLLNELPEDLQDQEVVVEGYEEGYDSVVGVIPKHLNLNLENRPYFLGIHELKEDSLPDEKPNGLFLRSTRNVRQS